MQVESHSVRVDSFRERFPSFFSKGLKLESMNYNNLYPDKLPTNLSISISKYESLGHTILW